MAQNFSNVMDYKVVANNGFQFNVNVYGMNNLGNKKWMLRAVDVIRDYFTFDDDADNGLIVNVIVNTHEIIVKAEFNGKKYFAFPIQPRYGKNQIKGILDNMGVVKDVIDVYTNSMVNNNMEENNMVDMVNKIDLFNEEMKSFVMEDYNDAISSAKDFADAYGDDCVENPYLCGTMDYDYDIREMWADFAWHGDVCDTFKDARDFYDEHKDLFISMEDIDNLVRGLDGTDDVGDGECLVWVKNPYYVEQEQVENNTPCLDGYDIDRGIERVVDTIKDYVDNYEGLLMDYDGNSASMYVPWDIFNEDDMKMLIEDDIFALSVRDVLYENKIIKSLGGFLVYDDGVYVSVDAKKFNKVA